MFGFGPLPIEGLRVSGPGLRTWHLLSALRSAGHEICLIADRVYGTYPENMPEIVTRQEDGWTYHSISDPRWHNPAALRPLVEAFGADCAIGVTTPATAVASELVGDLPLWGDLYGSIMAEAQLKALVYGDDSFLGHFWAQERKSIERADIFSAVSERQQWSIIGELGMWGRLNQWTSGYQFAVTIPISSETTPYPIPPRRVIRGIHANENDFVILYSGGYNTWTDVDTLFAALEMVMSHHPEVVFVSTGGKIEGHDDLTYTRFQALTGASPYRDRFHLCGWVPNEDVPAYYLESNLGVNVDRMSYEAMLGSRTRVLDWMRAGLPSVSSSLTELAQQTAGGGGGLVYQPGNAQDLAQCLRQCIVDRAATAEMGRRARRLLEERFTFEATTEQLRAWVAQPSHSPDYGRNVPKLVSSAQTVAAGVAQAIERRSLGLALALQIWPKIARVTGMLGLTRLQRWLVKVGMRALRLERPPYRVQYIHYQVPHQMQPGQAYQCPVRIRNTGSTSWPTSRDNPTGVNLAYHWLTTDKIMLLREGIRTQLVADLASRRTADLTLCVIPPDEPGIYLLELDMVREGVTWFSESGSPGPNLTIEVQRPEQNPTPL